MIGVGGSTQAELSVPSEGDGSNLVSLVGYRLTCKAKALVM